MDPLSKKVRDIRIDFIRGISMFVIVIYHYSCALELKRIEGPYRFLWHYASGKWGDAFAIVFLIVTGYVLIQHYEQSMDILGFYKKRWMNIFPLFYLTWLCMYWVRVVEYRSLTWGGDPRTLVESLLGMDGYLKGHRDNYYLVGEWFLGAIIFVYILFPLLRHLYKKKRKLVSAVFIGSWIFLSETGLIEESTRINLWYCLFAVWIGMLFYRYKNWICKWWMAICSATVCMLLCCVDLSDHVNEIVLLYIFAIVAFVFLFNVPVNKLKEGGWMKRLIGFLGTYTYPVMLIHHVLLYWGIKVLQIVKIDLNFGEIFVVIGIYIAAWGWKKGTDQIFGKIGMIKKEA